MKDLFTLKSKALPAGTRVAGFRGTEALSSVYRISVFLHIAHDEEFDMADALGARARLDILPGEYAIHGILSDVELLNDYAKSGLFRATLVPELWQLSLTRHSRIFVDESIPQIIAKVLQSSGLQGADFKIDVQGPYKALDHVCQYQESNLDFISRWMEREGMYYYFEQGEDREILVITDYLQSHHALSPKPVRYHPHSGGDTSAGASFESFTCKQARLPSAVHLKDYDYTKPSLDVSGSHPVSTTSLGEIHHYGENFLTPDEGKRLATVRSQEFLAREKVFHGDGRVYNLRSGYTFLLDDHPRAGFNADYLVTSIEHFGNQSSNVADLKKFMDLPFDDVYRCHVACIPAKTQFRAVRTTAMPRIYGVEEAVIDATAGHPYAEIDSHGRYKVKVKFDESDLDSGQASMWVRMLQPHGGDIEGFHFPLRKGTEVLLVFMGGDPDRPVITGVAHNSHNPSAVTVANSTKNVMQTGGRNRFEMEDQEGSQYIWQNTPPLDTFFYMGATFQAHNLILSTKGLGLIFTGSNLDIIVQGAMTTDVTLAVTETYHNIKTTDIALAVTETYHNTVTQEYGLHHDIKVLAGGRKEEITGIFEQELHTGYKKTVQAGMEEHISGGPGYTLTVTPNHDVDVTDLYHLHAKDVKWDIDNDITINCNKYSMTQRADVSHFTYGNYVGGYFGMKSEIFGGLKTDLFLGARGILTVGAKMDVTLGASIDAKLGLKVDIVAGITVEGKFGPVFKMKPFRLENAEVEVKAAKARLTAIELELAQREAMIFMCAIVVIM
jgi:type VI secretion system secreted protein VgrG